MQEYLFGGELFKQIAKLKHFSELKARDITRQILGTGKLNGPGDGAFLAAASDTRATESQNQISVACIGMSAARRGLAWCGIRQMAAEAT